MQWFLQSFPSQRHQRQYINNRCKSVEPSCQPAYKQVCSFKTFSFRHHIRFLRWPTAAKCGNNKNVVATIKMSLQQLKKRVCNKKSMSATAKIIKLPTCSRTIIVASNSRPTSNSCLSLGGECELKRHVVSVTCYAQSRSCSSLHPACMLCLYTLQIYSLCGVSDSDRGQ